MEYFGYLASILIALGLIVEVEAFLRFPFYLFAVQPVVATAYSLFIVGLTSAVGSVDYFKRIG
jgi:hypothetical protein